MSFKFDNNYLVRKLKNSMYGVMSSRNGTLLYKLGGSIDLSGNVTLPYKHGSSIELSRNVTLP